MKLKSLLLEVHSESDIRNAAWLYMLVYPYRGSMEIEDWKNDNRMDKNFIDSMNELSNKGIVDINKTEVLSNSKSKKYLKSVFGEFDDEESALEFGKKLERYDVSGLDGFQISRIPYDIFESDYENKVRSREKELFSSMKYYDLIPWLKKYQRDPKMNFKSEFRNLLGDPNLVDMSKKYILYRGLYIRNSNADYDKFKKLENGDQIYNTGLSWSWSFRTAESFSKGSTNYMDSEKYEEGSDIAIVLKRPFNHDEILCDLYYIDKQGYEFVLFPSEKEVIVYPKKIKCEIVKILK